MKLDLNSNISYRKHSYTWRLNNTVLNDQWVIEEIGKEIQKFLESNENENTAHRNLWDIEKALLKVKFIVVSDYIPPNNRSEVNNLMVFISSF
jgi:hypothetical protein